MTNTPEQEELQKIAVAILDHGYADGLSGMQDPTPECREETKLQLKKLEDFIAKEKTKSYNEALDKIMDKFNLHTARYHGSNRCPYCEVLEAIEALRR